jgi:hypothetical protein
MPSRIVTTHYRYKRPLILLVALMLPACSGVDVRPNPTNPAYMGVWAPGGSGWRGGSSIVSTTLCVDCL